MENVQITGEKFESKDEINAEALIFGSNESGKLVEVYVDKKAERSFRANLPTKIFKENRISDEKIKVIFRFENLDYLNEWLLQFGDKVEIISPKTLIKKRENLLQKMLDS